MNNDQKLCEITDIIPVRIFPDRAKKLGPIKPMLMSNSLIYSILNSRPAPKHFFALNPNNPTRKILLTKDNYNKTSEELFGSNKPKTTVNKNTVVNEPIKTVPEITPTKPVITEKVEIETENATTSVETPVETPVETEASKVVNEPVSATPVVEETIINMDDIDISTIETDNSNNKYLSKKNRKNR